jgi:hypothetical protein
VPGGLGEIGYGVMRMNGIDAGPVLEVNAAPGKDLLTV